MGRGHSALGTAIVLLLAVPSGAHAASQRTDPTASSPAGVIYQIPLDSGRRDAAPLPTGGGKRNGGGGTGVGTGGGSGPGGNGGSGSGAGGSSGSSGAAGGGTSGATGGSTGAGGTAGANAASPSASGPGSTSSSLPGGATPNDPSSIHSENGFGSSSKVPGVDAPAPVAADSKGGGGSSAPVYLLLALVAGLAVWVGASAARSAARV